MQVSDVPPIYAAMGFAGCGLGCPGLHGRELRAIAVTLVTPAPPGLWWRAGLDLHTPLTPSRAPDGMPSASRGSSRRSARCRFPHQIAHPRIPGRGTKQGRDFSHGSMVYTIGIYLEKTMTTTAKLFKNGRSQAVRLPREFRFEGDRVRVRRAGRGVLVEPMFTDVTSWFAELDRLASEPFMPKGRQQPAAPQRDVFDDDVPS